MKKIIVTLMAALICTFAGAQGQISTKKFKISDFRSKTTRIVLPGNTMLDAALTSSVKDRWNISPYELCTADEFEAKKTDPNSYFLIILKGQSRKEAEPGLEIISVLKGGPEAAEDISSMLELVSIPIRSSENPSGRELVFLPAILDIVQAHILASMESNLDGYTGLANASMSVGKIRNKKVVIADSDLSPKTFETLKADLEKASIEVLDEDDADALMLESSPETVVSYTVYPTDGNQGSVCYKLLIDCATHELFYFKKHKISKKSDTGLQSDDVARIVFAKQSQPLKEKILGK